jgi:hypothetical protein
LAKPSTGNVLINLFPVKSVIAVLLSKNLLILLIQVWEVVSNPGDFAFFQSVIRL